MASVLSGVVMKHFSYPTLVAACAIIAFSESATASTVGSCRSFAAAAADEWAEGKIVPADEFAWSDENHYILISYGKKFVVQRRKLSGQTIYRGDGELARQRTEVYHEELNRCLEGHNLSLNADVQ